jgi:hypothetical protein
MFNHLGALSAPPCCEQAAKLTGSPLVPAGQGQQWELLGAAYNSKACALHSHAICFRIAFLLAVSP